TGGVAHLAFSESGGRLLSAAGDGTLRCWDAKTGAEISCLDARRDEAGLVLLGLPIALQWMNSYALLDLNCAAFSAEGKLAVCGGGSSSAVLWDLQKRERVRYFPGHGRGVKSVALPPDGKHFLCGAWDGVIHLWDRTSGKEVRRFKGHEATVYGLAFAPDGRRFLSCAGWLPIALEPL